MAKVLRKITSVILFFVMAVALMVPFTAETVNAAGATINVEVTNSTVESESGGDLNVDTYEALHFVISFNVPEEASEGDFTKINLPNELKPINDENFNIYAPNGTDIVANATISANDKTIQWTYTDYVDNHNDVKGVVRFSLRVDQTVVTEEKEFPFQITGNLNTVINFGPVHYTSVGADTTKKFQKVSRGAESSNDTSKVNYELRINEQNEALTDAVVVDTLGNGGMEYDQTSFEIISGKWAVVEENGRTAWRIQNGQDVTTQFEITFNEDGTSFTINFGNIPEGTGYRVRYSVNSLVPLKNGDMVHNSATFDATEIQIVSANTRTEIQNASGEASGVTFALTIKKVNDKQEILPGAEFTVRRAFNNDVMGMITIGEDGTGTLTGLVRDVYIIEETVIPTGYQQAENTEVTVNGDTEITIVNNPTPTPDPTPEPSPEPSPSSTPEPTATPETTPTPSATPESTPTPTPTATPSATPTPNIPTVPNTSDRGLMGSGVALLIASCVALFAVKQLKD